MRELCRCFFRMTHVVTLFWFEVLPGCRLYRLEILFRPCDMESFAAALDPWPVALLPFVAVAFRESNEATFSEVLRGLLSGARPDLLALVGVDDVPHVYRKVRLLLELGHLPPPATPLVVPLLMSHCGDCGGAWRISTYPCSVLTFGHGLVQGVCEVGLCDHCGLAAFAGSGTFTHRPGVFVFHDPGLGPYFGMVSPHPQRCIFAFVETKVLCFLTLTIRHWRASFDGFQRIWASLYANSLSNRFRDSVFHTWLFWRAQVVLMHSPFQLEAWTVPLLLSQADGGGYYDCIVALTSLVRRWFLEAFARQHRCATCVAMPSVGVDNKVSLSARICNCLTGLCHSYTAVGVSVDYGCISRPVVHGRACVVHAPDPPAAAGHGAVRVCLAGHGLVPEVSLEPGWLYTCDVCDAPITSDATLFTCELGCYFDVCAACFEGSHMAVEPRRAVPPDSGCEVIDIDPAWDACNLAKPLPVPGAARGTGGVTSCMLACGIVCNIAICAGSESATQIFGMLGEIKAKRSIGYVIYDNACMLHRFVQNVVRRRSTSIGNQLATECCFVLDRFHKRNHVACLDPNHSLYLPSVDIDRYPALRGLNSSQNEQWNSWLDKFAAMVRSMRFETLDLYLLLVAELWNSDIAAQRPRPPDVPAAVPRPPLLKRRRRG